MPVTAWCRGELVACCVATALAVSPALFMLWWLLCGDLALQKRRPPKTTWRCTCSRNLACLPPANGKDGTGVSGVGATFPFFRCLLLWHRVYYFGDSWLRGAYMNNPHVLVRFDLDTVGPHAFTLVVSQYERWRDIYYTIDAFCMAPVCLAVSVPCGAVML